MKRQPLCEEKRTTEDVRFRRREKKTAFHVVDARGSVVVCFVLQILFLFLSLDACFLCNGFF
jgi:hypothetical protein